MCLFTSPSSTLDSSCLMERCGHDRERNNNNVTKLADRECLLHACSESKHCNRVFTLYFSWQLSTNNFCHLFHVQSRKSVKGNLLCLRLFLLWFSSPASSTCQAAFMFFFGLVTPPALQCDNMNMNNYSLICVMHVDPSLKKTLKTSELFGDIVSIRYIGPKGVQLGT